MCVCRVHVVAAHNILGGGWHSYRFVLAMCIYRICLCVGVRVCLARCFGCVVSRRGWRAFILFEPLFLKSDAQVSE